MRRKTSIKKWETNTRGLKNIAKEVTKDAKSYGVLIKVEKIKKVGKPKKGFTKYKVYHKHTGTIFKIPT